ncbi:MAG: hypothetical protein JRN20_12755 [Nitrososphaerota archaeon]|nr:hypothetical protein [Nitrososphaerota archaeon]
MTDSEKQILFICVENAGRSQIAEAFAKKHVSTHQAQTRCLLRN